MSYNIDTVDYVSGKLFITGTAAAEFLSMDLDMPENNLLERIVPTNPQAQEITEPWWNGEGSGSTYRDGTLHKILEKTTGHAALLFVWEGGDGMSALKVDNGVVTDGKVKITIE